ncbi:MAG TPA: hypothetical protein VGF48_23415 [Thermoanaerobaculia bacterium]
MRLVLTAAIALFLAGCGTSSCVRDEYDRREMFRVVWYPGFFAYSDHVDVQVYDDGTLIEKRNSKPTCVLLPKSAIAELERILSEHRANELLEAQPDRSIPDDGPRLTMHWRGQGSIIHELTPELRTLGCALDGFFMTWLGERNHLSPFTRQSSRCAGVA